MVDGKPTAYVCQNYACQLPVTDEQALSAQLVCAVVIADSSSPQPLHYRLPASACIMGPVC